MEDKIATVQDLIQVLQKYPKDAILCRQYPQHWWRDSEQLTVEDISHKFGITSSITTARGEKIEGNFLICEREYGFDY